MELLSGEAIWLFSFIFLAGFLCTQFLSNVLTLDSLLIFLLSTWIALFPNTWLASLSPESPVDALHEYLLTLVMMATLVPTIVWFLSTDPDDVTIRTALALSRLIGFGTTAMLVFWDQYFGEVFDPKSFHYTFYTLVTLTGVYAIHLGHNSSVNALSRSGNLNIHLHIDLLTSLVCACLCACLPEVLGALFGQTLDFLHVFLYRAYGLMTLGISCLPWIAPRFRSVTNKRAVLFSRALTMLLSLSLTVYKYRHGEIPEGWDSKLLLICLLIMTAPAAIGSMRPDQGSNWDFPWRGLRVPDVNLGITDPVDLFKKTNKSKAKTRGRAKSRGRSRRR